MAERGYPHRDIEVRGHQLRVHFNTMLTEPPGFDPLQHFRLRAAKLVVRRKCCGRWGQQFRHRGGYYTPGWCSVCGRQKDERFTFLELQPLLPPEWFQEQPQ